MQGSHVLMSWLELMEGVWGLGSRGLGGVGFWPAGLRGFRVLELLIDRAFLGFWVVFRTLSLEMVWAAAAGVRLGVVV